MMKNSGTIFFGGDINLKGHDIIKIGGPGAACSGSKFSLALFSVAFYFFIDYVIGCLTR